MSSPRSRSGACFNWRDRLISARPRAVHLSNELTGSPKAIEHAAGLAHIQAEIETGQDLTPRLSNRVNSGYLRTGQRPAQRLRSDLDLLLADWGIHHLHLAPAGGGRTADLLFGMFRRDDA